MLLGSGVLSAGQKPICSSGSGSSSFQVSFIHGKGCLPREDNHIMLEPDGPKRSLHSSFQTVLLRNPAANMLTGAVTLFLKVSLKEGPIGFKPHLKPADLVQAPHFMDEKTR